MRKLAQIANPANGKLAKVYYNSDLEEFCVKLSGAPNADYFTTERSDAMDTANAMVGIKVNTAAMTPTQLFAYTRGHTAKDLNPRPQRCIERINKQLKKVGHRLVRNLRGGSYYYLTRDSAGIGATVDCSIYAYSLEPTQKDFEFAASEINEAFVRAGRTAPIDI